MVRRVVKNSFGDWFAAFVNGDDDGQAAPYVVDAGIAMKYTAVFACVKVLSETLASLPIGLHKKLANGDRKDIRKGPLYEMLHYAANEEMTPYNLKEMLMTSLCLGGNAYAQKLRNKSGAVVGLYPIDWHMVEVKRNKTTGALEYIVRNGEEKTYTRREMFHIPGLSVDGLVGLTPIQYASRAIELGLTYEQFCVNFYKNGANTNMALLHPGVLKEEALQRLKKQIDEKQTGLRNVNRPFLLQEGMTIKELTINPVDAQLLESKNFQIEDICRIYRVPQHLIQKLDRATNNNIEHQSLEFVMYTMLPWLKRWEENINLQLLTPEDRADGVYAEFKIDALLRGDAKSRAEAYGMGRQWGWFSVNDVRKLENMNSIENGDIYLQPVNMVEAGTKPENTGEAVGKIMETQKEGG